MELMLSIIAVTVLVVTFLFSALVTLEALNVLQSQVFDYLNEYTCNEIQCIVEKWVYDTKVTERAAQHILLCFIKNVGNAKSKG